MKKTLLFAALLFMASCGGTAIQKSTPVQTGWVDEDTYTVQVAASNEENAVDKAKHRILKDIVDVRVRNNSRYTDIQKIQDEFDAPLRNGVIINRRTDPDGLTILFQIRDKGLKKKFERR